MPADVVMDESRDCRAQNRRVGAAGLGWFAYCSANSPIARASRTGPSRRAAGRYSLRPPRVGSVRRRFVGTQTATMAAKRPDGDGGLEQSAPMKRNERQTGGRRRIGAICPGETRWKADRRCGQEGADSQALGSCWSTKSCDSKNSAEQSTTL